VLLAAALCAGATGCKSAANYPDPSGPLYETRYAPEGKDGARSLRVATFNIEYGVHLDAALKVLTTAPELQDLDLLALQEMDAPGVDRIAKALRFNSLYAPSGVHPHTGRDFGAALLSPWPLLEPRKVVLPHGAHGSGLRRAAVGATLVRPAHRLRVYTVHLPSPFGVGGKDRREEVDVLLADAQDSPDPVIILGDLNSHDLGERFVERGYLWLTRDLGPTASELGVFHLAYDHVFARGLRPGPGTFAGVVRRNEHASDHRPVWAVLEVP
jgi:endonuclease/exonuclease/phosphatase family metal-dependent hydrolase